MSGIHDFKKQFALVVGDIMVDKYIIGDVERISPEAPVPVLLQRKTERRAGGCGNVAMNIVALGSKVRVVGAIGNDPEGDWLKTAMSNAGIDISFLFQSQVPTTTKTRIVSKNQQFIRIDDQDTRCFSPELLENFRINLSDYLNGITVVILSDYAKGFLTGDICRLIITESKKLGIPVIVDPKGKDPSKYYGVAVITPNIKEFIDLAGISDIKDDPVFLTEGLRLCRDNDLDYLFITRSEKGISVIDAKAGKKSDFPTLAKEVIDVTGAGDTVVSVVALAYGSHIDVDICALLSNHAASIVVSKFGVSQAGFNELLLASGLGLNDHIDINADEVISDINRLQSQGKKIVFTNGCFDIVHAGHISSFKQARAFGDVLVVGLNSDESIKRIKGDARPIIDLKHRKELLLSIRYVDYVISFDEDTPELLIQKIRPDVLVKGIEWKCKDVAGSEFVVKNGGQMKYIELEEGLSTTMIINKIKACGESL